MRVLVTGGNGFVGSAVIRHLLAAGYEVRALIRRKHNLSLLEGLDIEITEGDIIYPDTVEKAVKGCPIVINLASIYTFYPFWDKKAQAIYKVNVQGTINVLNAALKNKVERFIHTSTIATIGKRPDRKPSNEETGFNPRGASHYARSKYLAEQKVLKFCQKGLPAIILNPAIVIGERDYKPTPSGEPFVKFLNRAYPAYFDTTWSVADVDDVAQAHVAAIKNGKIGERYILCNKEHYTLKQIFTILEEISGIKSPWLRIPYPFLSAYIHIEELLSYYVFKKKPLMPTEGVKFCRMSTIYNNSKALNELGYKTTPFKDTLAKAVNWYRMNSYIEPRGILRIKAHGSKIVRFLMEQIGIDRFTDKLSFSTLSFYIVVMFLQRMKKLGFRPNEDGWRKVTQSYLRTEHSKFALAAFRLDFWSDLEIKPDMTLRAAKKHIIERLMRFPGEYPMGNWQLEWSRFSAKRREKRFIDMVCAEFDQKGNLQNLEPYLDSKPHGININNIETEFKELLVRWIIKSYNKTRTLEDRMRPMALKNELNRWILRQRLLADNKSKNNALYFTDRVLTAAFISFEILPPTKLPIGQERLHCPEFIKHKHPGFGHLNIVCRVTADFNEADIWIQFSHIPTDGVPVQEVLRSLKRRWGGCGDFRVPLAGYEKKPALELCSTENGKYAIFHLSQFVDFQPLCALRKLLNDKYPDKRGGIITIAAIFVWKLAHCSAFEDKKFAIPVDLRPVVYRSQIHSVRERTLGFIFIRPSIYFNKSAPEGGFLDFQNEFNRQLKSTRKRKSDSYALLENYALASPFMYSATLKLMPSAVKEFVGTVGVTIIKNADMFISPFSDIHTDGFIAISNFLIPAEDGNPVGNVSIKAPKNKITDYLDAIKKAAASQE